MNSLEAFKKLKEILISTYGSHTDAKVYEIWECLLDKIESELEYTTYIEERLKKYMEIESKIGIDLDILVHIFTKRMVFANLKVAPDSPYYWHYHAEGNRSEYSLYKDTEGFYLRCAGYNYYLKDFNKTFRFSTRTGYGKRMQEEK